MVQAAITNIAVGYYGTTTTSRTFTLPIGAESADRWIIPEINMVSASVLRDLLTLTVNGIDAFPGKGVVTHTSDSGTKLSTIYGRPVYVPAGTTVDIAITSDKSWVRVFATAWAVTGITANSTRTLASKAALDVNAGGLTIDVPANGLVLASLIANAAPTYTFTGVDGAPVYDSGTLAASQARLAHRSYTNHPAESAHAITAPLSAAQVNLLSAAAYTFDDNSATPSTVTVNDFVQNEILPRVSGTKLGNIKVKGAYSGTVANMPTRVQVRGVVGATEVYPWTNMTAANIAGGFITGFATGFPAGLVGFAIQIRTFNDNVSTTVPLASSALTTTTFGVGDVIAVGGSSTASMFCAIGAVSEPNPSNCYRMDRLSLDANGNGTYRTDTLGAGIRAIGNRLRALEADIPIAFLDFAVTGSKLEEWVNDGDTNKVALTSYITNHQGTVNCLCIPFLATDVMADVASNVNRFTTLISQIRTTAGKPTLTTLLGIGGQTDDANGPVLADYGITQATIQMELNDANVTVCSYRDRPYSGDGTHMTAAGVEQSGTRVGTQLAGVMRASGRAYKSPKPLSRTYDPVTGAFVVTLDLRGANSLVGLTGQSGITGFTASADGFATLLTIVSAVIVAPNQVRVVVAEKPAAAEIAYFQGKHPDNANSLCSNTSIAA